MPSRDNHGSSSPFASFGRSIFSPRREQANTADGYQESSAHVMDFESLHKLVADRLNELSDVGTVELLSVAWIQKLLDAFVDFQVEFKVIMSDNRAVVCKPAAVRAISDFFDRSLKALDICNATRDGIEKIRTWYKHLEIVLCALDSSQRATGEGQIRRARKALMDLALGMLDEKDSGSIFSQRNRSFGRHNNSKDHPHSRPGHSRSLSWSVSQSWSAAKQLQSLSNNLVPPRGVDITGTNGFVVAISTMNFVLVFVLWALVAAIPCQDRGLNIHISIPRQYAWGSPLQSLYERILEESKKRDRRNTSGLLKEIYQIEKAVRHLTDLVDLVQLPFTEEQKVEVQQEVQELAVVCEVLKKGLDPLERKVREVFRMIMNCRAEGLDILGNANLTE